MASKWLSIGAAVAVALGVAVLVSVLVLGSWGQKQQVEPPKIVLVPIDSVLVDSYVSGLVADLVKLAQRPDVAGVIFVINSPGGTVSATETLYSAVRGLNKTKYAVVSGLAASGAYYVAVATEKIYSTPSGWVGSIGVVAVLWPEQYLYDLPDYIYTTGPMKYHGRDLTEFYNDVERIRMNFVAAVLRGREGRIKVDAAVFETAAIFPASEALEMGLIDEIGGVFDAVRDMAKKLKLERYVVVSLKEALNATRRTAWAVEYGVLANSTPIPVFYIWPPAVQWNIQTSAPRDSAPPPATTEKPYVILDLSHGNMIPRSFIEVLRAELAQRGHILVTATSEAQLVSLLRNATALVVVNPTQPFSRDAARAVVDSAARGVRVAYFYDMRSSAIVVISGVAYVAPYSLFATFDSLLMYFNMSGLRSVYNYTAGQLDHRGNWQFVEAKPNSTWPLLRNVTRLILFSPSAVSTNAPHRLEVTGFVFGYGVANYTVAAQTGNFTFVGAVRTFTPYFITKGDNWQFFKNIVDWLVEKRPVGNATRPYVSGVIYATN